MTAPTPTERLTPNPILRAAITASGHSSRGFAEHVLGVDERTVRRYLRGDWPVPGPVAQLCSAILRDETLAAWLAPACTVKGCACRRILQSFSARRPNTSSKAIARVASNRTAKPRPSVDFLSLRIRPIRKNAG